MTTAQVLAGLMTTIAFLAGVCGKLWLDGNKAKTDLTEHLKSQAAEARKDIATSVESQVQLRVTVEKMYASVEELLRRGRPR